MRELLSSLSSAELAEWRAFYTVEPFGDAIADQRHGIAQANFANFNRDSKKRPEPFRPEDFIPWHPSHRSKPADGVLLRDPAKQAALIRSAMFKK